MTVKTTRFDMADYLDSEEAIQEYFRQVMDDGDPDEIVRALEHIAKVHGMTQLAKNTGLGMENLYQTFAEGSKPRFDIIMRITQALGLKLSVAHTG